VGVWRRGAAASVSARLHLRQHVGDLALTLGRGDYELDDAHYQDLRAPDGGIEVDAEALPLVSRGNANAAETIVVLIADEPFQ
jgi:hypothetical protein